MGLWGSGVPSDFILTIGRSSHCKIVAGVGPRLRQPPLYDHHNHDCDINSFSIWRRSGTFNSYVD